MDTAVGLVKSYLELCGYFVLAELPVRAPDRQGYHDVTDLDVIAVRFPHPPLPLPGRVSRPLEVFLQADPVLAIPEEGIDLIIGEVKEGQARLNKALHRTETIAFALRRVGCCPEAEILQQARLIAAQGQGEMRMPGALPCRVRLVVFAGRGLVSERGVHTVPLHHCVDFIGQTFGHTPDVLAHAQFKDPVLGWFALQAKLADAAPG